MNRSVSLRVHASLFLIAGLSASGISFAHSNIAKIETGSGGPYTIMVGLITYPARAGVPLEVTIGAVKDTPTLEGTHVVLTAIPAHSTESRATDPVALTLEEDETEYFEGKITMPVQGEWLLRFEITGPAGRGLVSIRIPVAAP